MSFLYKRGRIWWYYWRDENGSQQGESLETGDAVRAEVLKDERDAKLKAKGSGVPNREALWDTVKRDFLAGYQEGKTKEGHRQSLKLFEQFASPSKISDPTYQDAKGFRDHLQTAKSGRGRPYRPASINIHLRNLHAFFSEAVRAKFIAENPFAEIKPVPDTKRAPKYFRKDEIRSIIGEAGRSWPHDKLLMLLFFLYTGIRLGELINLRWASLDMEKRLFYLHGSEIWEPKDREEHAIALHPELFRGLKKHRKTSEYIFPGLSGGPRAIDAMGKLFNRLYRRAGITDRTGVHILRHSFLTHCNLPIKAKQRIAGHSDIRTTMRYDHVTPEDLAGVVKVSYD